MIAALDLQARIARAAQAAAYLAVCLPIAVLAVLAVLGIVAGAALSMVAVGLPVLLAASGGGRRLVRLDRRAANRFLGTQIPPLPAGVPTTGSPWRRSLDLLSDRSLWRVVGLLALTPALTAGLLAVALAPVVLLAWVVHLAVQGLAGTGGPDYFGPWSFGPAVGVALALLALPVAVVTLAVIDALHTLLGTITRALLSPRAVPGAPVRELLAESLGDHSVAIAYWLPDRGMFVDEQGARVELPHPSSRRAWTAVERDGRRVAAIIHDAALDTSSELVQAAASASSLAIDNERLKADLRARLEELRESRLRIVEATDDARRRIERDLHDGAQQQLVALALELRVLQTRIGRGEDVGDLIDGLSERLSSALADLRELARGIHPSILTDRGLRPAIASLADRSPVEVLCEVTVDDRLPAPIEAASYFLVAEALTNIAKHAGASEVRVELHRDDGHLLIEVVDDGIGGVTLDAGSGLRGLHDRVAVVDGELTIDSPAGAGTCLRARIPLPVEDS